MESLSHSELAEICFFPSVRKLLGADCPFITTADHNAHIIRHWFSCLNQAKDVDENIRKLKNELPVPEELWQRLDSHMNNLALQVQIDKQWSVKDLILARNIDINNVRNLILNADLQAIPAFRGLLQPQVLQQLNINVMPNVSGGIMSNTWAMEIQQCCFQIHAHFDLQARKKKSFEAEQKEARYALADAIKHELSNVGEYSRFSKKSWTNLSKDAQSERLLYYAHCLALKTHQQTWDIFLQIKDSPSDKVKWNQRKGVITNVILGSDPVPSVKAKSKTRAKPSPAAGPLQDFQGLMIDQAIVLILLWDPNVISPHGVNLELLCSFLWLVFDKKMDHSLLFGRAQRLIHSLEKALTKS